MAVAAAGHRWEVLIGSKKKGATQGIELIVCVTGSVVTTAVLGLATVTRVPELLLVEELLLLL